jgi:hypothetical protein
MIRMSIDLYVVFFYCFSETLNTCLKLCCKPCSVIIQEATKIAFNATQWNRIINNALRSHFDQKLIYEVLFKDNRLITIVIE